MLLRSYSTLYMNTQFSFFSKNSYTRAAAHIWPAQRKYGEEKKEGGSVMAIFLNAVCPVLPKFRNKTLLFASCCLHTDGPIFWVGESYTFSVLSNSMLSTWFFPKFPILELLVQAATPTTPGNMANLTCYFIFILVMGFAVAAHGYEFGLEPTGVDFYKVCVCCTWYLPVVLCVPTIRVYASSSLFFILLPFF